MLLTAPDLHCNRHLRRLQPLQLGLWPAPLPATTTATPTPAPTRAPTLPPTDAPPRHLGHLPRKHPAAAALADALPDALRAPRLHAAAAAAAAASATAAPPLAQFTCTCTAKRGAGGCGVERPRGSQDAAEERAVSLSRLVWSRVVSYVVALSSHRLFAFFVSSAFVSSRLVFFFCLIHRYLRFNGNKSIAWCGYWVGGKGGGSTCFDMRTTLGVCPDTGVWRLIGILLFFSFASELYFFYLLYASKHRVTMVPRGGAGIRSAARVSTSIYPTYSFFFPTFPRLRPWSPRRLII
jgi:hypothetical protein